MQLTANASPVRGDFDHRANFGRLCTKRATLYLTAGGRVLFPQLRASRGARVSWDQALDFAADEFAVLIRVHRPNSVAFDVSGHLQTNLATLQMNHGCGTRCGSCVRELKRLIALRGRKPYEHVASAPRGGRSQDER